jgi:hypothetical protein
LEQEIADAAELELEREGGETEDAN